MNALSVKRRHASIAAAFCLPIISGSVVLLYESRAVPSERAHEGGVLADAADMLAQLFGRAPGPRSGTFIFTKQVRDDKHPLAKAVGTSPKPPRQRALGKTFYEPPSAPRFPDAPERQPTTILFPPDLPQLGYGQQYSGPTSFQIPLEYGGNPPFYFLPPASGVGGDAPPPVAPIPEPSTWAMLLLGFGACGSLLRRRKMNKRSEAHA
ncbi:PEPxxWA-CTERM sorting domain-containing protein [Croceibacterium ferulae]|uniref:PEPxxWA-CTERM sorting domain-containing protein n=1 Tax=Croceibacterium ferulae TaxID=1854641 RepID=UPI000EAC1A44